MIEGPNWLCIVIELSLVLFKKVFGHVLLLPFSQNLCSKFYPSSSHNLALKALWRLGSGSLRMPWLPLEAHKRILAKSKKVAKPREFDKSIALKKTRDI